MQHFFSLLWWNNYIICLLEYFAITSGTSSGFTVLSVILFPKNSSVASAALWTTVLVAVFEAFSPVFVAAPNNCLQYFLDGFLPKDKNSYPIILILSCTWFYRSVCRLYLLTPNRQTMTWGRPLIALLWSKRPGP